MTFVIAMRNIAVVSNCCNPKKTKVTIDLDGFDEDELKEIIDQVAKPLKASTEINRNTSIKMTVKK